MVAERRSKPSKITAPWSREGWYGDHKRARRDPAIFEIIAREGRGVDPLGFRADAPSLGATAATHNPYFQIPLAVLFGAVGVFLFAKLQDSMVFAVLVSCFFGAGALVVLVMSVRRVPAWHRARRAVREHVRVHGGEFPDELRWHR